MLNVSIIVSDKDHPVFSVFEEWSRKQTTIKITLVNRVSELEEDGDFLFLVSCSEIISHKVRDKYKYCLILHASDLPNGRGWSPHVWGVINGERSITVSLLEAEDGVDSGKIWLKKKIILDGTELSDEINSKLFSAEIALIDKSIRHYQNIVPYSQSDDIKSNYFRKRTPEDSEINPNDSINSQFNLLRVCDPNRFPAFFTINGQKYTIKLTKVEKQDEK